MNNGDAPAFWATGLYRRFIEGDLFASPWSEIDVGCEACRGPGQAHVEWAAQDPSLRDSDPNRGLSVLLRDRDGVTWRMNAESGITQRSQPLQRNTEVGVCADCHSRRGTLKGGGHSDPEFLDHYMPAFLTESLYFPDRQIEDEVYVWGSFLQSRMYAAGVSCSDCHEPHRLELRASGDALCTQCHLPVKFVVAAHHGHPDSDAAADRLQRAVELSPETPRYAYVHAVALNSAGRRRSRCWRPPTSAIPTIQS